MDGNDTIDEEVIEIVKYSTEDSVEKKYNLKYFTTRRNFKT